MLNESDLKDFMSNFYGYGMLNSDIWMIGMEEGGGNSIEEIQARLKHWVEGGRCITEDVAEYHEKFGMGYFFSEKPKNQSTWNKLIRIMLAYHEIDTTLQNVKEFQRDEFARHDSNNCLLELFPLPSPSTGHWLYSTVSDIPWLKTREAYKEHLAPHRIAMLKELIELNGPELVVFYGNNPEYREYWTAIVDAPFSEITLDGRTAYRAEKGRTQFYIVSHPVATGITVEYFHELGRLARAPLN